MDVEESNMLEKGQNSADTGQDPAVGYRELYVP
jgi:hypothetical protein